ncbi:hypothetical protein HHK36_011422 [Tetracentron sinense]|uniref:Aminotransferase-like plant mobile domain-containing protein n=1 Tax=Tetracentron sinense TaxID=13715 RepID=A0A834ZCS6_TETSI|nr:hypothetical protein HHK36_011422 [Tetracentron sinense]
MKSQDKMEERISHFCSSNMVRPKRLKTGESSSARPEVDDDYVPLTEVEEQPRESSRVGASSSGARATSSRGRRQSDSDPVRSPITGWRCSWKPVLTFYQRVSLSLRDALGRTPLGPFLTIPRIQSDRRLVAALCERWFGETNTFHFPCCELAITPLDFVILTGIPIVGKVIPPLSVIPMDRAAGLMGVSPETVAADSGWEAGKAKLSWLASILEATAIAVIDLNSPAFTSVLRVFLLFILGSCFFMTDRSCVETSFLPLMDPIDRFDTFDWGGAIYASILAGLRRVSRGGGRSVRFFYHFLEMWAHEYLDPFCPSLKIPDVTSFPRSSRWSAPSSKVDSHLLDKARKELDRLTLRRMTPVLAHDTFMEGMRTAGVPIHHLVGEVVTHSFFLSWFRSVSIGPIMRPYSTRPGATEVGGRLVEKYFQMRPLLAILEEYNRELIEKNAHLRDRCATFEDPLVTLEAIPPYQCWPRPDVSFDFEAGPAQVKCLIREYDCSW